MKKKRVIIAGGGFAGIQLARNLNKNQFEILLIDKLNHHQFQPLFYQVATSQLEPSSISFPLRNIFRKKTNIQVRLARILEVFPQRKEIRTSIGSFTYDYLVIAIGCTSNFFGNKELAKHALTLKTTYDAIAIRNHILKNFEKIISADEQEKIPLQNLVIVGAGPTGVELAGAFAEIKRQILPHDYPGIDFSKFKILLIEGSKSSLSSMSESARFESKRYLVEMGVSFLTEVFVTNYDGTSLTLSTGEIVLTKTLIWAAGITGNPLLGLPKSSLGPGNRIKVDRFNQVEGLEGLFAIGDIAFMQTSKYPKGHPQVANVAINQAKLLARNMNRFERNESPVPFEYRDLGSMATIGRNKAVVDLPFLHLKGYPAWLIWMFLHLMLVLSVKNKLIIFINWAWAYVTKNTSLRLILSPEEENSVN